MYYSVYETNSKNNVLISNQMAPNLIIFLNRDNFPPIFRKGSVVILGNTYDIRLRDSI
jgi:hypothetical protein